MFNEKYFDLIDESQLPPKSRFLDPYDHTPFLPLPSETLANFTNRIVKSREEKNRPPLEPSQLRQLIIDSLFESTNVRARPDYFVQKQIPPTLAQTYSYIRALSFQLIHGRLPSTQQRESRANHCNTCSFHSKASAWSKTIVDLTRKLIGVQEDVTSEAEKSLGNCKMCGGCALKSKVNFDLLSTLAATNPDHIDNGLRAYSTDIFKQCWIFEESLSDPKAFEVLHRKIAAMNSNTPRTIAALQYMGNHKKRQSKS